MADPADIEVVKKIKQNEIELQDRNTVLRGIKPNVRIQSFVLVSVLTLVKLELHQLEGLVRGKTEETQGGRTQ